MTQRYHKRDHETTGEIDDIWIEQLRRGPEVTVYRRTTDEPFVPNLSVTEPVDALWLLGRGCTGEKDSDNRSCTLALCGIVDDHSSR